MKQEKIGHRGQNAKDEVHSAKLWKLAERFESTNERTVHLELGTDYEFALCVLYG